MGAWLFAQKVGSGDEQVKKHKWFMKFDTETEAAIVNFSKGYCQSKGLELSRWEEVVEFVKERFSFHHKDSHWIWFREPERYSFT